MSTINGKKPIAEKARTRATPLNMDDIFGNQLGVDPAIVKAIEAKGMVHRWINAKKLQEMGGYHHRGWKPIRMKEIGCDTLDLSSLTFGTDPEGYLRRGDNVLAVRPRELHEKHRAYLDQEARARSRANTNKAHAEQMRQFVKEAGLDVKVHEGFEDEEV